MHDGNHPQPAGEGTAWLLHHAGAAGASPLVLDSPHSWRDWPADAPPIAASQEALCSSWDAWVDELWAEAAGGRAPVLAARFHRAYIDANRARDDIDEQLLDAPWTPAARPSDKSARGFGLLRRYILPGVALYAQKLSVQDVRQRIATFYDPYHGKLAALIEAAHARHGVSVHIDCHSMKSLGNAMNEDNGLPRPDLVVSDLDGTSADGGLVRWVADRLAAQGLRVRINDPYRGGELIRRHGRPQAGRHSLQIEINRALYMDERRFERHEGYARLAAQLRAFVGELLQALESGQLPHRPPPA